MRPIPCTVFALILAAVPVITCAQPGLPAVGPGLPAPVVAPAGEPNSDNPFPEAQTLRGIIDSLDAEQRAGGAIYVPPAAPEQSPIPNVKAPAAPVTPGADAGFAGQPSLLPPALQAPPSAQGPETGSSLDDQSLRELARQQRALQEQQEREARAARAKDAWQRAGELAGDPGQPPLPFVPGMQGEGRAATDDAAARLSRLIEVQPKPAMVQLPRFVPGQVLAALRIAPSAAVQLIVQDLETRLALRRIDSADLPSIGIHLVLFELVGGQTVPGASASIAADARVVFAQPNYLSATAGEHRDSMAALQYGPRMMKVAQTHDRVTGRAIRVAVIDTGIDGQHPDLIGRIVMRANFADGDDVAEIHGTAISGVIAATADNDIGIFGVAPGAAVLAIRACSQRAPAVADGVCSAYALGRGLDFAIRHGARVINLSVAGPRDQLLPRLMARAHEAGIVVVAAVGNLGPKAGPLYPAAIDSVIAVTAVDAAAALYPAAIEGPFVSLSAPGVEIVTTSPGGAYAVHTGTSLAAAHVSGVVALVLQARPDLSPAAVRDLLESTARGLGPAKRSVRTGYGLVDACQAVDRALGVRLGC